VSYPAETVGVEWRQAVKCPRCGEECEQATVDVGVGEVPVGPWGCENCHWVEGVCEHGNTIPDPDCGCGV
jgi:hypothetical protein